MSKTKNELESQINENLIMLLRKQLVVNNDRRDELIEILSKDNHELTSYLKVLEDKEEDIKDVINHFENFFNN